MNDCWPVRASMKSKSVLIALADHADDAGACWPSIQRLADRTCMDVRSVRRAIVELESAGHVTADRSNGRHSHYFVHPKARAESPDPGQRVPGLAAATEDNVSPTPDSLTSDPGQRVHQPRADSPPNHHRTVIESSIEATTTEDAGGGRGKGQKKKGRTAIPSDFAISERVLSWAKGKGWTKDLDLRLDHFLRWARSDHAPTSGDWDVTFMQAIEADWAGIGKPIDYEKMIREMAAADAERAQWKVDREREATAMALAALPLELRGLNGSTIKEAMVGFGRMGRAHAEQQLAEDLEKQRIAKSA